MTPLSCLQVGKDQKAQAFLATLDNDPTIGSNVDCTSYYVSLLLRAMPGTVMRAAQLHESAAMWGCTKLLSVHLARLLAALMWQL